MADIEDGNYAPTDDEVGWACACGWYNDHNEHCEACGFQPPWGCDCRGCMELDEEIDEETWYDDTYDAPGWGHNQ